MPPQATVACRRTPPTCDYPRRRPYIRLHSRTGQCWRLHRQPLPDAACLRYVISPGDGYGHPLLPRRGSHLHSRRGHAHAPTRNRCLLPLASSLFRPYPRPPLHTGAMPKPRLQEAPCPLSLKQSLHATACFKRSMSLQKGAVPMPLLQERIGPASPVTGACHLVSSAYCISRRGPCPRFHRQPLPAIACFLIVPSPEELSAFFSSTRGPAPLASAESACLPSRVSHLHI